MQQTIKDSFSVSGIGLHSGRRAVITVKPALEDTGIWFKRLDVPQCQRWSMRTILMLLAAVCVQLLKILTVLRYLLWSI